jgi:hypothetical protein
MEHDTFASLKGLPDAELVGRVKALVTRDRQVGAELIAHLAEMETRDIHLREGYGSLFAYCRDALGLSEWEAYNRIEAARAVRRFPVILGLLADGSLNLTAVKLLAPHLTPENHTAVLQSALGKRKLEVQEIVARLAPRPDAASSIRRISVSESGRGGGASANIPAPEASALLASSSAAPPQLDLAVTAIDPRAAVAEPVPVVARAAVTPLAPDRYKLQLTISGETLERMRLAKDMLSHSIPSGDDAAVVDRALRALLVLLAKERFGETCKRRSPVSRSSRQDSGATIRKPAPRSPSAAVKCAVWVRDLGRCAFVGTGGHRCDERRFVEFHHVDPYALGGEATVDRIQLRCRSHNDYEGRLYFGARRDGGCRSRPPQAGELVLEQVRLSPSGSTS